MNSYKLILIFLALTSMACNTSTEESQYEELPLTEYEGISICVSDATTRTTINTDDMKSVEWLTDDCIYLWAQASGAATYSLAGAEFKQKYFHETYSQAVFTAEVDPMDSGTYTYFGVYPKPTSVSGSVVSYTLSSEQSGLYDGDMDIMVASPVTGDALSETPDEDLALSFSHLTHAVRINIPDGRNLFGQGVKQLEVTFPGEVVGDFSLDAAYDSSIATLSNGSKVVTLTFEEELDEGDYAWIFIAPCDLSGTLSFLAYNNYGYKSESISVDINKTMKAGSVTPITLTAPEAIPATTLELTIKNNYLGEEIETMTITAPSGALFTDGSSSVVLPYSADGVYSVGYYTNDYDAKFKAGSLSITYESESAIVSGDAISLSGITENTINSFSCDVPYLYYTDFSTISSTDSTETSTSSISGLTGWVGGNRSAWWSGKCVAVRSYSNLFGPYDSRMNSATFESFGLKSGVSVDVLVMFNSDWCKNKSSSMNLIIGRAASGDTEAGDTINGSSTIPMSNVSVTQSSTFTYREATIEGCESSHRIVWESDGTNGDYFNYDPVYIDNVKVQIAN